MTGALAAPRYMLDTNIVIYAAKGGSPALDARFAECLEGELVMSAITLGELEHGWARGHGDRDAARAVLDLVPVLPFDTAAARGFGEVMARLPKPIRRSYDRQIAGHARALGLIVVTRNIADFSDIEGLSVEAWG